VVLFLYHNLLIIYLFIIKITINSAMMIWADGGKVIKRDDLEERESENGREGMSWGGKMGKLGVNKINK
jgi:hypothetical protein